MVNKHIEDVLKNYNISYEENIRYKLDSVKSIQLIMEIEKIFNVEINDIDFKKTSSVMEIINEFVNNK
jgi:acyl carrier protein